MTSLYSSVALYTPPIDAVSSIVIATTSSMSIGSPPKNACGMAVSYFVPSIVAEKADAVKVMLKEPYNEQDCSE